MKRPADPFYWRVGMTVLAGCAAMGPDAHGVFRFGIFVILLLTLTAVPDNE